jgi:GT2 family glycosyltransferase
VDEVGGARARVVPSHGLGVARARNDGLRAAASDVVLVTDDDCTVPADWASTGWRLSTTHRGAIVTGRVLPVGDPRAVPSTKADPLPVDLSSERRGGWLFGNNMALPRDAVLELGGFDEHFGPNEAAEDNEFCYRWLRAGRTLRYEPSLVVEHHDWRSPEELRRLGDGHFDRLGDRGGVADRWRDESRSARRRVRKREESSKLLRSPNTGIVGARTPIPWRPLSNNSSSA